MPHGHAHHQQGHRGRELRLADLRPRRGLNGLSAFAEPPEALGPLHKAAQHPVATGARATVHRRPATVAAVVCAAIGVPARRRKQRPRGACPGHGPAPRRRSGRRRLHRAPGGAERDRRRLISPRRTAPGPGVRGGGIAGRPRSDLYVTTSASRREKSTAWSHMPAIFSAVWRSFSRMRQPTSAVSASPARSATRRSSS
jgi:hypothetical protein